VTRFVAEVEPHEPMRGLEVPADVVATLGGGPRPRVVVTLDGLSWSTRMALMRGRHLIGFSNAHRAATGAAVGDKVEIDVVLDTAPDVVDEPEDLRRALDADASARAAFDRLTVSRRRQHVRVIESAKQPQTRARRIDTLVATLHQSAAD
jgi:hypothetical protein